VEAAPPPTVEAARALVDGHDVEVWLLESRIAVLRHVK
jgi:hypothetical protein